MKARPRKPSRRSIDGAFWPEGELAPRTARGAAVVFERLERPPARSRRLPLPRSDFSPAPELE